MNPRPRSLAALLAIATFATPALAHDPKEHEKEAAAAAAKPDCAKLKTMDLSTMNPNDPVMKALTAKCAKAAAAPPHAEGHEPAEPEARSRDKKREPAAHAAHDGHGEH